MINSKNQFKKGQITLFMILGVLLLFSSGIYLYLHSKDATIVPQVRKTPVENYIQNCLTRTSREAIFLLGSRGGYINMPKEILNEPSTYISFDPTKGDIVPYWYFHGKKRIPTIEDMQQSIKEYVQVNFPLCIDSFNGLSESYEINQLGNISVDVNIGNDAVLVNVNYPLEVFEFKGNKMKFERFSEKNDVKIKEVYELAQEILDHENKATFLENITIDLMALNNDIPFTGLEFSCSKKRWYVQDIKKSIQDTIYQSFPDIRFKNTKYKQFMYPESDYKSKKNLEDNYEFNHFLITPSKNSYLDLRAFVVYYPNFGLDMVARPASRTGILESDATKAKDFFDFLCINMYHFTYDVYYPVTVVISDESALGGEGFIFKYAFPVMIDHNLPNRLNVGFSEIIKNPKYDAEFCNEKSGDDAQISAIGYDGAYDGVELGGVNITYRCFNAECSLGSTSDMDGRFVLKTKLPSSCSNGFVKAQKPGYLSNEIQMTQNFAEIPLIKLKTLNLAFSSQKDNFIGTDQEIENDEKVGYYLKANLNGTLFEKYGYFEKNETPSIELPITDATYYMDASLFKDDKLIGGYKGNLTIGFSDIDRAKKVTFRVLKKSYVPILDSEKYSLLQYLETNSTYREAMPPIFS